jgi:hypothetical protein
MPDERSSRLLSLLPQFGSFAVVVAFAAALIPGVKQTAAPVATPTAPAPAVPEPAHNPQDELNTFLRDARIKTNAITLDDSLFDRVLIATLPDPAGTDFGYWFDQCIESLGRAMADANGFSLERHWFGWLDTKPAAMANKLNDSSLKGENLGVLVYRKNDEPAVRRVVLIVRENAMNGVHRPTFLQALNLLPVRAGVPRVVKILGPSFSGSLPSILESLKAWGPVRSADVRLISGSAIGIGTEAPKSVDPGAEKLLIRSTHAHIVVQMKAMLHYLRDPGDTKPDDDFTLPDLGQVAFLIESNSGFGAAAFKGMQDGVTGDRKPWFLRFPLHVSKLTAILSTEQRQRDERLGLRNRGSLTTQDEARAKRDLVPASDELRTAELNKRLLDDFCTTLNRERVRFIGIIATDPRDKLYLFDLLHRSCPNARLFTHGADNHFVHPSYFRPMRGVLISSTYPLVPPLQQWTHVWRKESESRRLPFPSTYAQGLYNAMLAQLGESEKLLDYRPPAFTEAVGGSTLQPPVWIETVNERGQFTPLAYFTNNRDSSRWGKDGTLTWEVPENVAQVEAAEWDSQGREYAPPPFGPVAIAMGVVLGLVLAVGLVIRRAYSDTDFGLFNPYRPMVLRDWYVVLIALGVMLAAFPFAMYFHTLLHYGRYDHYLWSCEHPFNGTLFSLVILAGLLAPAVLLFAIWPAAAWACGVRRTQPASLTWRGLRIPAFAGLAVSTITTFGFLMANDHGPVNVSELLFIERAADLLGGASALLPCLLVAVGIAGFGQIGLRLLHLRERFKVECPYPTKEADLPPATEPTGLALRRIRTAMKSIDDTLWENARSWRRVLLYGIAIGAGLLFAVPSYFNAHHTWDGRLWDVVFLLGFSVLAAFAAVSAFRFIVLWRSVKLILRGIAGVPMVGAFDRLPERTSAMLARFLLVGRRRFSDLAVPYRLLAELRDSTTGSTRNAIDAALRLNPEAGTDPDIHGGEASKLSTVSRELVLALLPAWGRKNVVEAYGSQPLKADEPPQGPQAIAEQFIAVQAVFFVSQYFTQLRYFAYMGTFTAGCLLFALTEYHFEPEHLVMMSGAGLTAAVVAVVAWGLVEINKSELVSRVTRTTPGRFSLDSAPLVMNAVQLAGPLVVLLLLQMSGRLRSVVEPVVDVFR